jgi:hypothetical protein
MMQSLLQVRGASAKSVKKHFGSLVKKLLAV